MAQLKFQTLEEAVQKAKECLANESFVQIIKSLEHPLGAENNEIRYFVETGDDGGMIRSWESDLFTFSARYGVNSAAGKAERTRAKVQLEKLNLEPVS